MFEKLKNYNIFFIISMVALLILGLYLRVQFYLSNPPLWIDEALYGVNFLSGKLRIVNLYAYQLAPPLFTVLVFMTVKIFGLNQLIFRSIPFLSGILSLFAFAFLINKTIKNKFAIIFGMFLFAVNIPLVYYSGEFKCYSTDVLVCILLLIAYKNFNIKELTNKKIALYSLVAMFLVLFSFPAMFVIPAMVISKFIEERKITYKALWIIFGVIISCAFMYYITPKHLYLYMQNYWSTKTYGFLELNVTSFKNTVIEFFEFWTQEHSSLLKFNIFFVIAGLIKFFAEKRKEAIFYSLIFLFLIIASLLKIYPCSDRLILFLMPVIILLISALIDFTNIKPFSIIMTVTVCFLCFNTMQMRHLSYHLAPANLPSVKYKLEDRIAIKNIIGIFLKNHKKERLITFSNEFRAHLECYANFRGINNIWKKVTKQDFASFFLE